MPVVLLGKPYGYIAYSTILGHTYQPTGTIITLYGDSIAIRPRAAPNDTDLFCFPVTSARQHFCLSLITPH